MMAADRCEKSRVGPQFDRTLTMIANKLAAVWYHKARYEEIENRLLAEEGKRTRQMGDPVEYSNELFFECDACLVQIKSCLDHLVKLPAAFIGKGWNLATFGEKGDAVIKAARNSVPDRLKGFAEGFVMVIEAHKAWLEDTINARDRINHMQEGGIDPAEVFALWPIKDAKGTISVRVPTWFGQQTVREFLQVSWERLFAICEDFVCMSIAMGLPDEIAFVRNKGFDVRSVDSPWVLADRKAVEADAAKDPGMTVRRPPDREARRGPSKKRT
jgi:hypothetical protein